MDRTLHDMRNDLAVAIGTMCALLDGKMEPTPLVNAQTAHYHHDGKRLRRRSRCLSRKLAALRAMIERWTTSES